MGSSGDLQPMGTITKTQLWPNYWGMRTWELRFWRSNVHTRLATWLFLRLWEVFLLSVWVCLYIYDYIWPTINKCLCTYLYKSNQKTKWHVVGMLTCKLFFFRVVPWNRFFISSEEGARLLPADPGAAVLHQQEGLRPDSMDH